MRMLILIFGLATQAAAETCPPGQDHSSSLDALFAKAQAAPNERAAYGLSDQMWQLWTDAPDAKSQALLDRGMERRARFAFAEALESFDALTAYCPAYAEGWNQRAFVHFLRQDFDAARQDLATAYDLDPKHVGVLTGQALTFIALGEEAAAQDALAAAVELNPWVQERHLLKAPPAREDEEL